MPANKKTPRILTVPDGDFYEAISDYKKEIGNDGDELTKEQVAFVFRSVLEEWLNPFWNEDAK